MPRSEESTVGSASRGHSNSRKGSSSRRSSRRNRSSGGTSSVQKPARRNHSSGTSNSPKQVVKRNHSPENSVSGSTISSLPSSIVTYDDFSISGHSVVKTLTLVRSQPANRSCADCRSALIDPSEIFASLCVAVPAGTNNAYIKKRPSVRKISIHDFRLNHRAFAPPGNISIPAGESVASGCSNRSHTTTSEYDDDPAFTSNQRFGGHGVFICARCAEAHRELGSHIEVKRVIDSSLWTIEEAQFIVKNGGNALCWKVYECYMPDQWKERRPIYSSSLSTRLLFCRAKYEALAFCLPQPGPNARKAWEKILQNQQVKNKKSSGSAYLKNRSITSLSLSNHSQRFTSHDSPSKKNKAKKNGLPNRLIDYFCVISSSMQLLPSKTINKKKRPKKVQYSNISSPEALDFWPHVTDCYPPQGTHGEMGYEDHISSFVMPDGCHPTLDPKPPSFSTFVLTMADGSFLYGGSLQIYDEHVDAEEIKKSMRVSGYEGDFPDFLMHNGDATNGSDVFFFPKCLVFLSRYAFFDLFRSVLLEIYQISLIAAPLPIERYVSNFVCEIPLPPQGQIKVEFSFTTNRKFVIERPPINELPMANFSYRPLFVSLSVSNIMVVLGYLLQEQKVVLLSKHNSLLTPVAEALLSALFPFRWVGLYIPVAPLKMMEILDAPIPYLIGLSSEYFSLVDSRHRPEDAIFVDLDRDVIHIGDDMPLPKIPEHDAQKLSSSLEQAGGSVYVIPNSGIKGCIMAGFKRALLVQNEHRPRYAHMTTMTVLENNAFSRDDLFAICDLAYGKNDDESERINGFGCIDGQLTTMKETNSTDGKKKLRPAILSPIKKPKIPLSRKNAILSRSQLATSQIHLLDMAEPEGFSVADIRNAFLRFTVATFANYQDSLVENSGRDLFDEEKFVEDIGPRRGGSMIFLKNVLRSQLFQRFLEERKENAEIPEIKFFDESIIKKRNRSKIETIAKGGKKLTPFLDDKTTWEVKKIFTPPQPNNLGLPDAETTYRYGTFPVLDAVRFGRIRPPKRWRQHSSLDSVRHSKKFNSKMKKSQNEFFKNALKPLATPKAIAAAAKQGARDLESTLSALSIPAIKRQEKTDISGKEKLSSSVGNVKTLSTADMIMMDARRKQVILLDFIVQIQAHCRRFLVRNYYVRNKYEIIEAKWESQQHVRRQLEEKGSISIQRFVRMRLAMSQKRRMLKSIVTIQSKQRSFSKRKRWVLMKDSAIVIAKFVKARRAQIPFKELRRVVTTVQSRVRGVLVRSRMQKMMRQKMDLYTTQIFVLWTYLHVSLIFRAKLWPQISGGNNFLSLRLAESELQRLWDIANFSDRYGAKYSDKISQYCYSIGLSNDVYHRSKKCADWIKDGASIVPEHSNALRLEETERLQIYERLNSTVAENDVSTLYGNFDIAPDEKMKKVALSQILWTKIVQADRSSTSMSFIFPELKDSLGIKFSKPSSKGQRRFPGALKDPIPPIDYKLWEEMSAEGKTKRHVQEVAMLFITKVPELSNKLDAINMTRKDDFDSFLVAVMKANGFQMVEQARRFIFTRYLGKKWDESIIPAIEIMDTSVELRIS